MFACINSCIYLNFWTMHKLGFLFNQALFYEIDQWILLLYWYIHDLWWLIWSIWVPSTPSMSPSRVQLFKNNCCREAFKKLNSKRKIWAERFVILDEVNLAIRANLESRGWLSSLEIDHPPLTTLIREFFSNLSCHVYDSNTLVRSWIRGVEFTITPRVVAEALGFRSLQSLSIPMLRLLY